MRRGALGLDRAHAIICNSARDKGAGLDRIVTAPLCAPQTCFTAQRAP